MKDYRQIMTSLLAELCDSRKIEVKDQENREEMIKKLFKHDLEEKTKAELQEIAEENDLMIPKSLKKEELTEVLASFFTAEEEDTEADTEETSEEEKQENKNAKKSAAKEARAERRKQIAKVKEATSAITESDIDERAFGEDSEMVPRQIKSAPKSLSISGDRLIKVRPGEEEDIALTESYNNAAQILTGVVSMVTPPRTIRMENPETGESMNYVNVSAIVEFGTRTVYIPAKYFFEDYFEMDQDKIREYMNGRLGSEVDFRVVAIDRTDPSYPVYTGSRVVAMRKKRCDFWYSERQIGQSLIQPGSDQEARVVAVSARLVFVEIFGAEIKVEPNEIAYEYVVDARDYYQPGDVVIARIKSVALQDKKRAGSLGYPVECEVSLKDVYENPKELYFKNQMWGAGFKGKVSNIQIGANNVVNFFVDDGRIDIMCHLGKNITKRPARGDYVTGVITGMDETTGFVWGVILHVDRNRFERRARPESFVIKR